MQTLGPGDAAEKAGYLLPKPLVAHDHEWEGPAPSGQAESLRGTPLSPLGVQGYNSSLARRARGGA